VTDELKVYYPGGGRMFLLHWWTQDERGHIILSPTESAVRATAELVFAKHPDAEIKAFCEVDIVGPSPEMRRVAERWLRHNRVYMFLSAEIVWRLRDLLEAGKPLPAQFSVCETYEPEDAADPNENEDTKKWIAERHTDCRHCKERVQLVGMTPEEFYDRYAAAWYLAHPHREHVDRRLVSSQAPPAADGEALWYVEGRFGDHSAGAELQEVNLAEAEADEYQPAYVFERAMFYFRRGRELDATPLLESLKGAAERQKARWDKREEERKAEHAKAEVDRMEDIVRFFAERA
jgi:hypothetical protein